MAQSPAGKPRKTPKPAASPKKAAGSSASKPKAKPAPKAKPPAKPVPVPRKKPAPPPSPAPKKRATAKKAAAKSPSTALADTKKPAPQQPLTLKQQRFVEEYMVDLNATQAAIRAGYSADTAHSIGHENLSKPEVARFLQEARKAQQERTGITADQVLREIALIAFADTRELVEGKKGACRHCHGEGFKRQHTIGEQNARMEAHAKKGGLPAEFDEEGGIGYNPHLQPHPACPECMGEGTLHVIIKDTRYLSPAGVALYAGIKQTKEGVEVKMHPKTDALEKLAKFVGLYEKDNKQKVDPLAELLHSIASSVGNGFKPVANDPEHDGR